MKEVLKIIIKITICIVISLGISYYLVNNNIFKQGIKSSVYKETEEYLNNEENKDINAIKEKIDEVNNPKVEVPEVPEIPDDPSGMSPKDIFQQNKILMIGDSFVEGMEAYGVLYSSNAIWERGKRIDNMSDQLAKGVEYNPTSLILVYGSNDVQMWDYNVDGFINAYSNSLDNITSSLPNTKIYVCSILPVNEVGLIEDPSFQYVDLFNQRLEELCNQRGIPFLDSSYILNLESDPYSPDGIHPKGFYYEKWALDILNKMR